MKYHKTDEGAWMRCRAVKRRGHGVTDCPIGDAAHASGRAGIASLGGGIEARWEDGKHVHATISPLRKDGTFTVTSPKGFRKVYTSIGRLLTLRERAKATPRTD
jgi:hypothetical protein